MKTHSLLLGLLCMSMALTCSCSNDDSPASQPNEGITSVTLSIVSVTREGDSASRATESLTYEDGDLNEKKITDAVIILYDKPLNDPGTGTVLKIISLYDLGGDVASSVITPGYYASASNSDPTDISMSNRETYRVDLLNQQTLAQDLQSLKGKTVYAVALANIDVTNEANFSTPIKEGMKVSALRDVVYTGPLYDDHSQIDILHDGTVQYTDFAMTAINEVKFDVVYDAEGKLTIPTLMVQRLAARIDIAFGVQATSYDGNTHYLTDRLVDTSDKYKGWQFDLDVFTDGTYRFPIYDEAEHQNHNEVRIADTFLRLIGIELVNCAYEGTYLFEHSSGSPTYLGNEGGWSTTAEGIKYANYNIVSAARSHNNRMRADMVETGLNTHVYTTTTGNRSAVTAVSNNLKLPSPKNTLQSVGGDPIWGTYSILGYVGENTYSSYNASNKYTTIRLKCSIPAHLGNHLKDTDETADMQTVYVDVPLRHSFGSGIDTSKNLFYGTVRNTIYRVYVKFYAYGDNFYARWYYYSNSDGNKTHFDASDEESISAFYSYILEGDGGTPND